MDASQRTDRNIRKDISNNITDLECFESYIACRLIPLSHQTFITAMIAQSNTIPDKGEQQTLINEAKLEKAQELQERAKQIEEALPISTRQVIKQTKMVGASN